MPGASFRTPRGQPPGVMTRARSRRKWWDALARIAVRRLRRVSLESLMITKRCQGIIWDSHGGAPQSFIVTKRCQGHRLGFPRGSHQGVLREPVRAESGWTPQLELPFGAPDVSLLRTSCSPNAARGFIWDSQGGATLDVFTSPFVPILVGRLS